MNFLWTLDSLIFVFLLFATVVTFIGWLLWTGVTILIDWTRAQARALCRMAFA